MAIDFSPLLQQKAYRNQLAARLEAMRGPRWEEVGDYVDYPILHPEQRVPAGWVMGRPGSLSSGEKSRRENLRLSSAMRMRQAGMSFGGGRVAESRGQTSSEPTSTDVYNAAIMSGAFRPGTSPAYVFDRLSDNGGPIDNSMKSTSARYQLPMQGGGGGAQPPWLCTFDATPVSQTREPVGRRSRGPASRPTPRAGNVKATPRSSPAGWRTSTHGHAVVHTPEG